MMSNAKFLLILLALLDLTTAEFEVRWWKRGENKFLQPGIDKRKRIGVMSKGSANLDLRNAMLQDSGIYHCTVIRQGAFYGNGTGTKLTVCISPAPIKIYSKPRKDNSSKSLTLVCQTSAFHPGDFTLVWYKNGTAITPEIIKKQNAKGLYEAFSSLEETQPERTEVVYICLAMTDEHNKLNTNRFDLADLNDKYQFIWTSGYVMGGLAILLFIIIVGIKICPKHNGKEEKVTTVNSYDEQFEIDLNAMCIFFQRRQEQKIALELHKLCHNVRFSFRAIVLV
ncbi:hypothetical protein chiPu_0004840 [Chiloscyllium punctatum]|uniref:Ig-like domain-containing protein n=1 Tax=Chiloscyllium punctatum TaxID=137246 RepID=A0A401S7P9_CHIPU|nr:hypothetical protein [Chiloscyllium punctatum]